MLLTLPWRESHEQPLQPARDPERAYFSSLHLHHKVRSQGTCEVLLLSVRLFCPFFNCGRLGHVPVPVLKGSPFCPSALQDCPNEPGEAFSDLPAPAVALFSADLLYELRSGNLPFPQNILGLYPAHDGVLWP